ncbi:MAG: acetyl-CoA carboxylase biotin carboxyl carrier protein subunit [Bacteroidetes bacterium]|nr:MAG: acetyl-CoA carboxylase biotin carboxyl carrier protein subunit [Bacteroidota bacterium]
MYKITVNNKEIYNVELNDSSATINNKDYLFDLIKISDNQFNILQNYKSFNLNIISADHKSKSFEIEVNGTVYKVDVKDKYDQLLESLGMDTLNNSKENVIKAPMPGLVLETMVKKGQSIKIGEGVLILEAMKMENVLKSPSDGVIKQVKVKVGDKVDKNDPLILLD